MNHLKRRVRLRRRLAVEVLEPRCLLAVIANPDSYSVPVGEVFSTESVVVVPRRASDWRSFDDITRTINEYPTDLARPGVPWHDEAFDPDGPLSFGAWDSPRDAPFAHAGGIGPSVDILGLAQPNSPVEAPAGTVTTVLFRRPLVLSAPMAAAALGTVDLLCDDGCIVYLNGVEVARQDMPEGPVRPNDFAASVGSETYFTRHWINLAAAGIDLTAGEANVLAVELHNINTMSLDLGFDLSLEFFLSHPRVGANDDEGAAIPPIAYWLDEQPHDVASGNPAGTIALAPSGDFSYWPSEGYPNASAGDSGTARFYYTVRDGENMSQSYATLRVYTGCPADADLDHDGDVDRGDLAHLTASYGRRGATPAQGDLDCDGAVGLTDLVQFRNRLTVGAPSPAAADAALTWDAHRAAPLQSEDRNDQTAPFDAGRRWRRAPAWFGERPAIERTAAAPRAARRLVRPRADFPSLAFG